MISKQRIGIAFILVSICRTHYKPSDAFIVMGCRHRITRVATTDVFVPNLDDSSDIDFVRKMASGCRHQTTLVTPILSSNSDYNSDKNSLYRTVTRRQVMKKAAQIAAGGVTWNAASYRRHIANAGTEELMATTTSLCDHTVISMAKGQRIIHIVGTAHISSISANLAGRVVRDIKPGAVFVELDLRRLGRAFRGGQPPPGISIGFQDEQGNLRTGHVRAATGSGPTKMLAKLFNSGSSFFGNPIQRMYENLEEQGFLAGEEFITAIEAGLDLNSVIILGDRNMDVTIQRLAMAITKTDPKSFLEAEKMMSKVMKERIPEIHQWEKQPETFGADELRSFVETMKAEGTTDLLMDVFRKKTPEIYDALVGERDEYMSRNLNSLSQFQTTVAVMGLGHLHGVEKKLRRLGWSKIPKRC